MTAAYFCLLNWFNYISIVLVFMLQFPGPKFAYLLIY